MAERENLRGYVVSLLGRRRHAADDVVQETLLRAWQLAERLDWRDRPIRMWLFRVARNIVIDLHRHEGWSIPVGIEASDFGAALTTPDPADEIADRQFLLELLRDLSPAQREAVVRVHLLGRPGDEVADVLGVPVGTVKSRTSYGVRALRAELVRRGWDEAAA